MRVHPPPKRKPYRLSPIKVRKRRGSKGPLSCRGGAAKIGVEGAHTWHDHDVCVLGRWAVEEQGHVCICPFSNS